MATSTPHTCPQCNENLPFSPVDGVLRYCSVCQLPITVVAGKYEILRMLAKGGCGVLYVAKHQRLHMDPYRVIKFVDARLVDSHVAMARFAREVEVTSALSQRNHHIVRVYDDFGDMPNLGYFFVMEYLQGQDLSEYMQSLRRDMPIKQAIHIMQQVGQAIRDAHLAGVVHRDLKPQNIFLVQRGQEKFFVKVIDFGIAKTETSASVLGLTKGLLGTPAYMSPEQCSGKEVDHRSDIYSLGIMLYQLVVGRLPFVSSATGDVSPMQLAFAQVSQAPPHPRELRPDRQIHPHLESIILKALAKDPDRRQQSMDELLRELSEVTPHLQESLPQIVQAMPPLHTVPSRGTPSGAVEQREQQNAEPSSSPTDPRKHNLPSGSPESPEESSRTSTSRKRLPTGDVEPTLLTFPEEHPRHTPEKNRRPSSLSGDTQVSRSQRMVMALVIAFFAVFFVGGALWLLLFSPKGASSLERPQPPKERNQDNRLGVTKVLPPEKSIIPGVQRTVQTSPNPEQSNVPVVVKTTIRQTQNPDLPTQPRRIKPRRVKPRRVNPPRSAIITRSTPQVRSHRGISGCPADTSSRRWVRLDVKPAGVQLQTQYPFEKRKNWYCLEQTAEISSALVRLLLDGHSPCYFYWPKHRRILRVSLQKEGSRDELSPPENYCLR